MQRGWRGNWWSRRRARGVGRRSRESIVLDTEGGSVEMGMFDTVVFTCPNCEIPIERQTKAGICELNMYSSLAVPITVAESLEDTDVECPNCEEVWTVTPEHPYVKSIPLALTQKDGN